MICPICGKYGSRRQWADSQWKACQPVCNGIIGCKPCRLEVEDFPLAHLEFGASFVKRLERSLIVAKTHRSRFFNLANFWMTRFSADFRKDLSHLGAIRTIDGCHPVQFECPVLGKTFDPSNEVYALTLKAIVPSFSTYDWNEETFGDIAEGILAVGLGVYPMPEVCFPMQIDVAAELLERLAQDVYSVLCFFPAYNDVPRLHILSKIVQTTIWLRPDNHLVEPEEVD